MIVAGKRNLLVDMNSAFEIAALLEEALPYLYGDSQTKARMYAESITNEASELQPPYHTNINKVF